MPIPKQRVFHLPVRHKRAKKKSKQELIDEATSYLESRKVSFEQPSAFQIKVGFYNYYPTNGKIYIDGDVECLEIKGIESFYVLLMEQGELG